jgi:hypothetical protein
MLLLLLLMLLFAVMCLDFQHRYHPFVLCQPGHPSIEAAAAAAAAAATASKALRCSTQASINTHMLMPLLYTTKTLTRPQLIAYSSL